MLFKDWFVWSLNHGDCDPAVWMANYLNKRFELNVEQMYWFAWLYGNTYYLPTAWVVINEFPDMELVDQGRLERWNTENYRRLRYQVDTKWNKGHLPRMFASYKEFLGGKSQHEKFLSLCQGSPQENFDSLWSSLTKSLFKFGRYSTWFYMQQLKYTTGLNIEPTSLKFKDWSGSRSHRNGWLIALGRKDLVDQPLTGEDVDWLEREATVFLNQCKEEYPHLSHLCEPFMMETALCSYKKFFREHNTRYLGYYLDRQAEEISQVEKDGWYGIEWRVLWEAREEGDYLSAYSPLRSNNG